MVAHTWVNYVFGVSVALAIIKLVTAGVLQSMIDVKGNNAIKQIRILYYQQRQDIGNITTVYPLIRGVPLYAEIDFIPRYIPQLTYYMAISVSLPEKLRNKEWIIGWHQEVFQLPECRLCTNTNQSFTMPVTLVLSDDGWCPEGRVPTIWRVEALPFNSRDTDQTDMIIGLLYDNQNQFRILNSNQTVLCKDRHEVIIID